MSYDRVIPPPEQVKENFEAMMNGEGGPSFGTFVLTAVVCSVLLTVGVSHYYGVNIIDAPYSVARIFLTTAPFALILAGALVLVGQMNRHREILEDVSDTVRSDRAQDITRK